MPHFDWSLSCICKISLCTRSLQREWCAFLFLVFSLICAALIKSTFDCIVCFDKKLCRVCVWIKRCHRLEWCRSLAAPQTWAVPPDSRRWLQCLFFFSFASLFATLKASLFMFSEQVNAHMCVQGSVLRITGNLSLNELFDSCYPFVQVTMATSAC